MTAPGGQPTLERTIWAAALAIALFALSWTALHHGFYAQPPQIADTPVYQHYGNLITDGHVPYRDFDLEYPPGALPMFALPGLAGHGVGQDVTPGFRRTFETLMWLCGAGALLSLAFGLRALRSGGAAICAAPALAALAPLALGPVLLSRFDLWPAAIVAGALAALLSGRLRLGHALLGLGVVVKLFPAILLPLGVTFSWKRRGRREALVCLGITAAVVALVFLPFVVLSPGGVWRSLTVQLRRPLQVESLGAALLLAAHHAFGVGITGDTSHGSQNLAGGAADAVAVVSTIAQLAVLLWIWIMFARGPGDREQLARASVAAVCAFIAFGKVLSPQFLIWLIPVVPLVRGRRGVAAGALLGAALVLTQIWFPHRYFRLALDFEPGLSWLLLARDLVLVALTAVLVSSRHRGASRPGSP